jgi:hypothetical protein
MSPDNFNAHYNAHHVNFDETTRTMTLKMEGTSGTRVVPKVPDQLYGQFEVTAKVDGAVGAVTAFYVSALYSRE